VSYELQDRTLVAIDDAVRFEMEITKWITARWQH